jgi:S1-C subfamily serine protease
MIDRVRNDTPLYSLEVEWRRMPLATARNFGLPEAWTRQYELLNPERRQILAVATIVAGSPAAEFLRPGDILLSVNGVRANTFREVERASQSAEVEVVIFRDGQEFTETLTTVPLAGEGIDRIVLWAGALLQPPHRAISAQRGIAADGVYVSYFGFGSPASRSGLYAGRRILAVDGQPTPDLDAFINAVRGLNDRDSVRLNTVTWNDVNQVITLNLDNHYWPTYELRRVDGDWQRRSLE